MVRRTLIGVITATALLAVALPLSGGDAGRATRRATGSGTQAALVLPAWAQKLLARAPLSGVPGPMPRVLGGQPSAAPLASDPYRRLHGYACPIAAAGNVVATPCARHARTVFVAPGA